MRKIEDGNREAVRETGKHLLCRVATRVVAVEEKPHVSNVRFEQEVNLPI